MLSIRCVGRLLAAHLLALYAILSIHGWIRSFRPLPPTDTLASKTDIHQMTWRDPFTYDIAIYASPLRSFYDDQSHFFIDAQHIATLRNNKLDSKLRRFRKSMRINKASDTMYLHLFMQESGKMNPHPAMGDKLLVQAHTQLAGGRKRVAWEVMLDNHVFADRRMPTDVRRISVMRYYSPSERRAYGPIAWDNPLVAVNDAQGNSNASSYVDVSLDQVSLEWMRIAAQFVRAPLDPFASSGSGIAASMDEQDVRLVAIIVRLADYAKLSSIVLGVCWVVGIVAQALVFVIDLESMLGSLLFTASTPSPLKRGILYGCSVAAESVRLFILFVHSKQPMLPGYMFTTCAGYLICPMLYVLLATTLALSVVATRKTSSTKQDSHLDLLLARQIIAAVAWTFDAVLRLLLLPEAKYAALIPIAPLVAAAYLFYKSKTCEQHQTKRPKSN
ncbi:hypothetical protein IW140_005566 [Coemansia sp. RSA 1813]|nr:hypothetical protein EV178_005673 [Coemansia sp. RSA 1646]KAJ1767089.1 hypothetical protein LPJ74_005553 [Coemansia sp. RSA 1843]KAJ2086534.1 hypothetical protein IW138_005618 [Coemansia sp. RSA 986]KAJ2211877.1 hypothetical protein EV179_005111 [Coemansia sp. RSA 487]KAJ2564884.1 hypothetical protein IW140_005566 [Coemansia sp. RSA 1813]